MILHLRSSVAASSLGDSILTCGNDAKRLIQTSYGIQKTAMETRVIPTKRYIHLTTAYAHKKEEEARLHRPLQLI